MRIGTYNIYGFQGFPEEEARRSLGALESPERIAHFTRVFAELDCDILALQEGGASPAMMHQLARRLGAHLATIPSPGAWPGQLLSRYPVLESRTFSHFSPSESVPPLSRCAGAARLQLEGGSRLWVVVLHLHPGDRAMRDREAAIIDERVRELLQDGDPMVVLGDFNCEIDEAIHGLLTTRGFVNAMQCAGGGLRPTIDTASKQFKGIIDHVYVSPELASRLKSARVVDGPGFRQDEPREPGVWDHSDHLPVVAEFA